MTKARKIVAAALLSLIVFLMIPPTSGTASSKARTYKVGANVMFGVSKTDAGYSGLACDYLNAISKYTGDRFAYVDGTEEELFRMLKSGEIDLIPCVTESERIYYESLLGGGNGEDLFAPTRNTLLSRFGAVYVYDGGKYGDVVLGDISALRHMSIGYLVSDKPRYFDGDELIYSELEGASFISYNTESVMQSDLVSGKIDAVMKDCMRPWANETVAYQFPAKRGSFITRTGDKLADRLEGALTLLFRDRPTFYGEIYERYIANYGSQKFAYNAQESEFIKNHEEITLAFNLEVDVMHSYDAKKGTIDGVVGLLAEKYTETTGLKVNIKPYSNLAECLSALGEGEVDLVYGGVHTGDALDRQGYYVTEPAINFPLVLAGKANAEISGTMKIAVDSGNNEAISSLARFFPEASIVYSEDVRDGCDMAEKGTCNVMCLTGYDAMYLKRNGYPALNIKQVLPVYSTQCFAARAEDKGLIGVTETALIKINGSEVIANIYNMLEVEEYSAPRTGVRLWLVMTIVAVLAVIAAGVIILIMLENKRRSEIDPLTGGPTKSVFLDIAAKNVKKSGSVRWAVILFDIDKFKFINDRLGYEEGNRMLERLYKTLGDHMEKGETYARMSDDNFVCCIRDASNEDITERLESVFDEFSRRNSLFVPFPVVFSAGVCKLEQCTEKNGAVDMNVAIDRCNIAKRTIKDIHNSSIAFYDGKIREKALREKDFENVMPAALKRREFMCYVQPKYGTRSRRIEGGEALIRWSSKEFGFVFPDEFIPLSEKNGFVVELDFFILEEVCKAMRRWLDEGREPVVISVNQSRMHLSHDDYIWRLREIVDKYNVPYDYIELEITETVFTENADLLLNVMQKLHDIGFRLSIDDFGSGYSSLNMLKDIPADAVKIDREFFNGTVNTDKGRAVISTVVDLAKKLKMYIISEGVETLDQVEFLDEINCDLIQGYYFAKPMPIQDFEALWIRELEGEAESS